ncbi:LacI family DNA-binding transcriptional regulator [Parapedobacter lycopersici]|uniref:LacI family DNA-binding transcriptional regulator n=1 Tax=Parapedobacter lycopersici TaxID=1864939 RepID=UPI00333FDB58
MARKKNVSLKDIALKSGVSTALVSYVLNGKAQQSRVGKETAARIMQVAEELNYQPNLIAKSLRSGKSFTIGLVIADIANPFFANIARIVDDVARKYNYTIIIGSCDENAEKSANVLRVMINRKVDGFIIVSSEGSEEQLRYLQQQHIPFVLLDRHFPQLKTDYVVTDNHRAAYDAGIHLVAGGYRKIGMMAYDTTLFHMQERIKGYQDALHDSGIVPQESWLRKINQFNVSEEINAALEEMLRADDPIDAMIFSTNDLAVNSIKYLNRLGLKIPQVFAAVSFGQAEWFDLYQCPISYVKQSVDLLATKAVEILIKNLDRTDDNRVEQVRINATLVTRASSRPKAEVL